MNQKQQQEEEGKQVASLISNLTPEDRITFLNSFIRNVDTESLSFIATLSANLRTRKERTNGDDSNGNRSAGVPGTAAASKVPVISSGKSAYFMPEEPLPL